jgi:hypothetical protein
MIRDDLVHEATQLGRQVQQLGNRSAITDLVNRLGVWLDEKRFDEAGLYVTSKTEGAHHNRRHQDDRVPCQGPCQGQGP